ncbi:hypothetical protein P154DRAFT_623379 [Amniculicola lignicola CBS 123094]|uniref:Rad21/Rec8-like protein N-terminal domain-containing protein n=1 Tax=Amniculicola lignicola CBS 123094 TaxID=1392246 RepID=A0A6A5W2P9_9PLEO|nr:hypothetical protein P154DRAFT_623379 [Amniculicola lignicola CBS 123094]
MFYSHEVLTSRKYGVATVWLVATLGAKSNLKKINRKAILDVDVPKACRTIIDPVAPMALRLQGNLLYGVSRVYLQQCGYVLADAQNAQNAMRMMLKVVNNAALDPEAGKARPEQLVLPDDPSFLPEFSLPPLELLAELNLSLPLPTPRSGDSQSLTPFGSQLAQGTPGPVGGLVIPSSSSGPGADYQIGGDDDFGSFGGQEYTMGGTNQPLEEADFDIDDDGMVLDFTPGRQAPGTPAVPEGVMAHSDAGASARVRREHEEGQDAGAELLEEAMDLDLPTFDDVLPEGEAFPTAAQPHASDQTQATESSPTVVATQRKKRGPRTLPSDQTQELRNKDLADWNANYLNNMREAARQKAAYKASSLAKKNAEYWVWGAGKNNNKHRPNDFAGQASVQMIFGNDLFDLFAGVSRKQLAGTKHDRDSGIDEATEGESRRVRHKEGGEEDQVGRGDEDEAMFMQGDEDIELPREQPSLLDDKQIFSAMPWNMSSSAVPQSGRVGVLGSTAGVSSVTGRRGSRMVSASPLQGRGLAGGLEALRSLEGDDDLGSFGDNDFGPPYIPGSSVGPSTPVKPSFRVREALSTETSNFLLFVSQAIAEKKQRMLADLEPMSDVLQADAASHTNDVLFEELLPPTENTAMVAAQGLMMVLALGTTGLLSVRQDTDTEDYYRSIDQDIGLGITEKGRKLQDEADEQVLAAQAETEQEVGGDDVEEGVLGTAGGPIAIEDDGDDDGVDDDGDDDGDDQRGNFENDSLYGNH